MKRDLVVIGAIGALVVAATGAAAWFLPTQTVSAPPAPPVATAAQPPKPAEPSWIPAGFSAWPGQDVAFRVNKSTFRPGCRENTFCMLVEVVPRFGCDSLYVAASMLDGTGRNIGFTNDTTSGVGAGQAALLAMNASEGAARSMRISEISCR